MTLKTACQQYLILKTRACMGQQRWSSDEYMVGEEAMCNNRLVFVLSYNLAFKNMGAWRSLRSAGVGLIDGQDAEGSAVPGR